MDSFCPMSCSCPLTDPGPVPYTVEVSRRARQNHNFRVAVWTGNHLQVTLMCIPAGEDIGPEMHPQTDQLIRVEDGEATVCMGQSPEAMTFRRCVKRGSAILIPCGTWHNVMNTGRSALKLSSVYAPPQHLRGTVHRTKADAQHED